MNTEPGTSPTSALLARCLGLAEDALPALADREIAAQMPPACALAYVTAGGEVAHALRFLHALAPASGARVAADLAALLHASGDRQAADVERLAFRSSDPLLVVDVACRIGLSISTVRSQAVALLLAPGDAEPHLLWLARLALGADLKGIDDAAAQACLALTSEWPLEVTVPTHAVDRLRLACWKACHGRQQAALYLYNDVLAAQRGEPLDADATEWRVRVARVLGLSPEPPAAQAVDENILGGSDWQTAISHHAEGFITDEELQAALSAAVERAAVMQPSEIFALLAGIESMVRAQEATPFEMAADVERTPWRAEQLKQCRDRLRNAASLSFELIDLDAQRLLKLALRMPPGDAERVGALVEVEPLLAGAPDKAALRSVPLLALAWAQEGRVDDALALIATHRDAASARLSISVLCAKQQRLADAAQLLGDAIAAAAAGQSGSIGATSISWALHQLGAQLPAAHAWDPALARLDEVCRHQRLTPFFPEPER